MKNLWVTLFFVATLAMFGCGDGASSGNHTVDLDSVFPTQFTVDGETYFKDQFCIGTIHKLSKQLAAGEGDVDPKNFFADLSDNDNTNNWYVTYRTERGKTAARGQFKCYDSRPYGVTISVVRYPSAEAANQALSKYPLKDFMWAKADLLFAESGGGAGFVNKVRDKF